MEAITNGKAMHGIEVYLERSGMRILENGWAHGRDKIDFVADDDGELAFVSCNIRENDGKGLGFETPDRLMFERIAAAYLAENTDIPEGPVRFDMVSMVVLDGHKALLRHHRNALSAADSDLD